jgi:hypothetical protein
MICDMTFEFCVFCNISVTKIISKYLFHKLAIYLLFTFNTFSNRSNSM